VVFDQTIASWLRLHRAAFEFFGGVPRRVVLDNLRAAIVHAALYDPEVQRSYRDFAEHYGFLIAPCRPRTPEHKGKVEQGGVHYVKRNALAGRTFRDVHEANRHLGRWCVEIAGRRVHGTTKRIPLEVFDQVERAALGPVPPTPWELVEWKKAKLHADCHVVFAGAYYSAPHRLIGQRLWVRGTPSKIQLFHDYALVAMHLRARPGQRRTLTAHLPPDKVRYPADAGLVPRTCHRGRPRLCRVHRRALDDRRSIASECGSPPPRPALGAPRLEAACARALTVGECRYQTVKTILISALDQQPLPALTPAATSSVPPAVPRHARPWTTVVPDPGAEDGRSASWN
jgi:hypothetical protein